MEYLLLLAAFGLGIAGCRQIWIWIFMPRSSRVTKSSKKRTTHLKAAISELESRKQLERKIALAELFEQVPVIGLSPERRQEIKNLLSAVDKRVAGDRLVIVEEVYFQQLTMAGAVIGFSMLGLLFNRFAFLGLFLIPIVMGMPLNDLKEERQRTSAAISAQFLEFYKTYYVQFRRRDATGTLSNVIKAFIPRAQPEFRRVLTRLMSDLESGEDYALRQLDNRFPDNMKVHKFCSIVRARSKDDLGAYDSMRSFLEELEEQRDAYYDQELQRRSEMIGRVVAVYLCLVFSAIMIVQIFAMTQS